MAQVTIYLADDLEAQARKAAKAEGTSLGRWVAGQIAEKVKNVWPPEVLAALGSFPDLADQATLRDGDGTDVARENFD